MLAGEPRALELGFASVLGLIAASRVPPPLAASDSAPAPAAGLPASAERSPPPLAWPVRLPEAKPLPREPDPVRDGMVRLPAAYFVMGADDGDEARPIHEVAVARFDLDRTEVTVAAYRACVDEGSCEAPHEGPFCNGLDAARDDHPVNCIDATMAEAVCAFRDSRLPTEEEWEFAARGGAEHRRFSWGLEPPDGTRACYDHPGTCPVASFAPGAFDLYDVSGNVWEWTSSFFAPYPEPATSGEYRVYRGGSWSRRFPRWLNVGLRNRYKPEEWSAALGARCARTVEPLACPEDAERDGDRCKRVRGEASIAVAARPGDDTRAVDSADLTAKAAANEDLEASPVKRARSPEFDADCATHHPKTPRAYMITGGRFQDRHANGCSRRDVGRGYTGICCID